MPLNCPLCGSINLKFCFNLSARKVYKCNNCHLKFLHPLPDEKELSAIYKNYYDSWKLEEFNSEVSQMKARTFDGYLDAISRFTTPSGKLLDIGCATGELLERAEMMGFDVYGVEISPEGVAKSRKKFGDDKIINKKLSEEDFPKEFFSVITMSDVIEHIEKPGEFMKILSGILAKNGLIFMVTPDTSSWIKKILKKNWLHYKEEHLYYYNKENIRLVIGSDFEIIHSGQAYKFLSLNYMGNIIASYSRNSLLSMILRVLPYSWKIRNFKLNIGEMAIICRKK